MSVASVATDQEVVESDENKWGEKPTTCVALDPQDYFCADLVLAPEER